MMATIRNKSTDHGDALRRHCPSARASWYMFSAKGHPTSKTAEISTRSSCRFPRAERPGCQTIETSGHWESIQRAGTCYFRCILCTIRYLMKRDGFTQLQQKQLFVQIRAGFMDQVERDLESGLLGGEDGPMAFAVRRDFRDSDARMIRMGAHQTLFAALKLNKRGAKAQMRSGTQEGKTKGVEEAGDGIAVTDPTPLSNQGITVAGLQRLDDQMARILALVDRVDKIDVASDDLPALDMKKSAPLLPFAGFGLIADKRDPEIFAGEGRPRI